MRYSTEPKYGKYVRGFASLSFDRKFNDKYAKRLMDTAKKKLELTLQKLPQKE